MSLHYIVDGYNALHTSQKWADVPRERQREQFLTYLDKSGIAGSERNRLTIVLDGYAAKLKNMMFHRLQLVFSGDHDADTVIKNFVAEMVNPREAVVVTNDRAIQSAVRGMGARVMSCEEFFQLKKPKKGTLRRNTLDPASVESVNRELKRLWKLE